MAMMGRPTLFGRNDPKVRYQGSMTKEGAKLFEDTRRHIANFVGIPVKKVSDGAVTEYLARGAKNAEQILAKHRT
jgi:hypothetical protein